MIRMPETDEFTINVKLKTGTEFLKRDVTNQPFGDHGNVVSFWHGDAIRMYPLVDVEYVEVVPEKDE